MQVLGWQFSRGCIGSKLRSVSAVTTGPCTHQIPTLRLQAVLFLTCCLSAPHLLYILSCGNCSDTLRYFLPSKHIIIPEWRSLVLLAVAERTRMVLGDFSSIELQTSSRSVHYELESGHSLGMVMASLGSFWGEPGTSKALHHCSKPSQLHRLLKSLFFLPGGGWLLLYAHISSCINNYLSVLSIHLKGLFPVC